MGFSIWPKGGQRPLLAESGRLSCGAVTVLTDGMAGTNSHPLKHGFFCSLLAAPLASICATVIWPNILYGVQTDPNFIGFVIAYSVATMFFTFPGAILLTGMNAFLLSWVSSNRIRRTLLVLFGTIAGVFMLPIVLGAAISSEESVLGGFYGFTTASAFVTLQWYFLDHLPKSR